MKSLFRLRPRRVVAAFAVLVGMLLPAVGGAMSSPASAACTKVGVYKYHSKVGKSYQWGPTCVVPDMGWSTHHYDLGVLDDGPPAGTLSGAGIDVWLASPV